MIVYFFTYMYAFQSAGRTYFISDGSSANLEIGAPIGGIIGGILSGLLLIAIVSIVFCLRRTYDVRFSFKRKCDGNSGLYN